MEKLVKQINKISIELLLAMFPIATNKYWDSATFFFWEGMLRDSEVHTWIDFQPQTLINYHSEQLKVRSQHENTLRSRDSGLLGNPVVAAFSQLWLLLHGHLTPLSHSPATQFHRTSRAFFQLFVLTRAHSHVFYKKLIIPRWIIAPGRARYYTSYMTEIIPFAAFVD